MESENKEADSQPPAEPESTAATGDDNDDVDSVNDGSVIEEITEEDQKVYRRVVEKMIGMINAPKGEEHKSNFQAIIDSLYHTSYVRHVAVDMNGTSTTAKFEEFRKEVMRWCEIPDIEFRVFRYKLVEPGCLDHYLRLADKDRIFSISGLYFYNKDAMIYRGDLRKRQFEENTSGHRLASEATRERFGCKFHEVPSALNGQLLGKSARMLPADEKNEMLRLDMIYDKHHNLEKSEGSGRGAGEDGGRQRSGSAVTSFFQQGAAEFQQAMQKMFWWKDDYAIQLTVGNGMPYAKGAYFRVSKGAFGAKRIVLYDFEGNPVALCVRDKSLKMFHLYGTLPLRQHSTLLPHTEDLGGEVGRVPFYPWFTVCKEDSLVVSSTKGTKDDPLYIVQVLSSDSVGVTGDPIFEPLYRVDDMEKISGKESITTLVDYYWPEDRVMAIKLEKEANHLVLDVAPGVDPALALCVVVTLKDLKKH